MANDMTKMFNSRERIEDGVQVERTGYARERRYSLEHGESDGCRTRW